MPPPRCASLLAGFVLSLLHSFEVGGHGPVGIYGAGSTAWKTGMPWETLHEGDGFDLQARSVVK